MKNDYLMAVEGIKKHLVRKTEPNGYVYTGSYSGMNQGGFRFEMVGMRLCSVPWSVLTDHLHRLAILLDIF